ncbi:MAG TPA: hypothetical protein VJC21_01975 [Candidatus Nanoarchaeia archaeon]|nr:hypothetical protein [Candidatus Nanoarchaeia archaeon]
MREKTAPGSRTQPFLFRALFLLILLLFVASCQGRSGERQIEYNFKQGVAEVELALLENAPPEQLYPNTDFQLVVTIDNKAAYDVQEGELRIIGLDEKYFDVYPLSQIFSLQGRSLTNPSGEKAFLQFDGRAGELFLNAEEYAGTYFLKAAYTSTVDFTDTVCLNADAYGIYTGGCKLEAEKSYSGQGAPLAVTRMEEIVSPGSGDVEFRFTIENRGQGTVNDVTLLAAQLGGQELSCAFKGEEEGQLRIRLTPEEQEAVVLCHRTLRGEPSYETTVTLQFRYTYEIKEEQELRLVR